MRFKLALALHNHQPVGNFNAVFEEAHNKCYRAFIDLVKEYPEIKFSFHQSGILWDWQKNNHPEYFNVIGELIDRGQTELLTGGFYEPILPAIPELDKIGQIKKLSSFLQKHFDVTPRGMWLAERVWEPHLPRTINASGVEYLPLDDTHFIYTGLNEDDLFGPYITEESGYKVTIFPILQKLRYLIPFGRPEEIIDFLAEIARHNPDGLAVYADDGEKFGVWPETHHHCYVDGWLKRFFDILRQNSDWLEVVTLGEAYDKVRPLNRVYLPSASYKEMLEWSLPAEGVVALEDFEASLKENNLFDAYGRFVRGGHWRGFLTKYEEANLIHKKMLAVSDLLREAESRGGEHTANIETARDRLYAGQCNCPYWHGVFGGLYLPHLRWAVYQKLTEAEYLLRRELDNLKTVEICDRDKDGYDEVIVSNEKIGLVINPHNGGRIDEVSLWDRHINVTDVLSRHREGYHHKLEMAAESEDNGSARSIHERIKTKEEGLEKLLVDDWYLRRPLVDHFLADDIDLKKFLWGHYRDFGNFARETFGFSTESGDGEEIITLTRQGRVWDGDYNSPVNLVKKIIFPRDDYKFGIEYTLTQSDREIMNMNFAPEFCFNLLAPEAEDRFVLVNGKRPKENDNLAAVAEDRQVYELAYHDEYQKIGIKLECNLASTVWRMPIYTVSQSEDGFEKVFQGHSAVFIFNKSLIANKDFRIRFDLTVAPLEILISDNKGDRNRSARV